ncbi:MAG TPA: GWxTD domain-containing protein [Gemmatimonadales bacterium]
MSRMPTWRTVIALHALAWILAPDAGAQGYEAAERRLRAGDTTGALELYERLSRRRGRDAELHYRIGVLHASRVQPDQSVSADRRSAEEHLRLATRLAPDSAPYWLALAELLRAQTEVTVRLQVVEMLERAREAARRHRSPLRGRIEYRLGRVNWERYEQAANRHELVDGTADIDQDRFLNDWSYVEELFRRRLRPSFRGMVEWRQTLGNLEATLESEPLHLDAAGLYVVALGEFGQWDSAVAVTARLIETATDSGRAWLLRGLTLARTDRWREADAAFDSALARLTAAAAAPYFAIERVLTPEQSEDWAALGLSGRTTFAGRHWRTTDPLWLTPENEARLEFLARVAYADHRWADDLRGYRGYEADRGAVYVRYGPPDRAATLGPEGADRPALTIIRNPGRDDPDQFRQDAAERLDRARNRLLWVYERSRRRYLFGLTPGYARAVFAGDAAGRFDTDRRTVPRTWDNLPLVRRLDSIPITLLRFEDGAGAGELAVFGTLPLSLDRSVGDAAAAEIALFVARADSVERFATDSARQLAPGVWRWRIPQPSDTTMSLRVEARAAGGDRAGRGSVVPGEWPVAFGGLRLSDLLVAAGRVDTTSYTRWFDLDVAPLAGPLPAGEPVTLAWEVYGVPAGTGAAYTVEIRLTAEAVERRGLFARIVGGTADALGLSAVGDDVLVLRYERARDPGPVSLEYLTLDLGDTPPGRYRLTVSVADPTSVGPRVIQQVIEIASPSR